MSFLDSIADIIRMVLGRLNPGGKRSRLRASISDDLQLLTALESTGRFTPDSDAEKALLSRISADVAALSEQTTQTQRDKGTIIAGALMAIGFGLLAWLFHERADGWRWYIWVYAVLAAFGIFGFLGAVFPPERPQSEASRPDPANGAKPHPR